MALPTIDDFKKIANLYIALFKRAPDSAGLNFWATAVANGASLSTVTQGFLAAPEGVATYPATQTADAFVKAFYLTTFGRSPDEGGLQFWMAALANGGGVGSAAARAQLVTQITSVVSTALSAAQAALSANAQTVADRALFANKVEYSLFLAQQTTLAGPNWVAANMSLAQLTADPASVTALKTAALAMQGAGGGAVLDAPKVFAHTYAELSVVGATFLGGTGVDSLALTMTAAGNVAGTPANVANIERITIYTEAASSPTVTIDAARFAGATTLISASAKELVFNNLNAGQVGLVTGKNAANGDIANGNTTFNYANGVTQAVLNLTGGVDQGTVAAFGAALTSVSMTATAGPNTVAGIQMGSGVNTLAITTSGLLTIGAGGITGNTGNSLSVTVAGTGFVDFSTSTSTVRPALLSLNASSNSGGVSARISADAARATTVVGSSGSDTIRLYGAFAAGTSVNLGNGDDTLSGEGASFGAGSVVSGGAGTNTLSFYAVSAGNGAVFQNFQTLGLAANTTPVASSVDMLTLTGTTITSLTLGPGKTVDSTINNVTQNLFVTANATTATAVTTLGVINAAATNYTITFNSATAGLVDAGVIAINAVVGLNIVSNGAVGTNNKITLSDAALTTLVITGSSALQVAFTGTTTGMDSIDATALTKAFTLDTTNVVAALGGVVIKGSTTAANSLTIAQKATVSGGTAADSFNLANAGVAGTSDGNITDKLVIITSFGVGDKIDFGTIGGGSVGTSLFTYALTGGETTSSAATAAVVAAAGQVGPTAKEFAAFVLGGSTFIVADINHSGTFDANDVVVQLNGSVSLVGAVVDVANATVALPAV